MTGYAKKLLAVALLLNASFVTAQAAGAENVGNGQGKQFITGGCKTDADCASGCCGFNTGKCAGAIVALQRDGGCGFNEAPNDNAARKLGFTGGITSPSTGLKGNNGQQQQNNNQQQQNNNNQQQQNNNQQQNN